MAASTRDKSEAFRQVHRFLVDRERSGSTFTLDELAGTASWKKSSARTNLGKKLKELVEKTAAGYKVAGVGAYSEDEFTRLMSQRQAVSADPKKPRLPPSVEVLVLKARESALLALQIYNNPTTSFRTEGYAVLMVIAWTALLHAIFEKRGVDYFHKDREGKPVTVDGDSKAWELARCLKEFYGGTACAVRANLELMTGLRNRVEHRYAPGIDPHVAGECQAMLFNFDEMMTSEFGSYFALRESLAVPLQTSTVRHVEQAKAMKSLQTRHFDEIKAFVDTFRNTQPDAILQDPHFRFRVYLVPKVGTASSSDMAFEFIKFDPQNPDAFKDLEKHVALIREQRVPVAHARFLPKQVVAAVRTRLGKHFSMDLHTRAWRKYQVRPRGFQLTGCSERYCAPDPAHEDYLYTQDWIDFLLNRLADDAEYAAVKAFKG